MLRTLTLDSVTFDDVSTSLTADVASTATVLPVAWIAGFTVLPARLQLNGTNYTVTGYDETASTLTLATGLTAAAAAGDEVLALSTADEPRAALAAWCRDLADAEALPYKVDTSRAPFLTLETPAGTDVTVDTDLRMVVGRPNITTGIDASQLVGDLPDPTDIAITAPSSSPAILTAVGMATGIQVQTEAIGPTAKLRYIVDGVVVDDETRSPVDFLTTDSTGAPMAVGAVYQLQVQAYNSEGAPAPSPVVAASLNPELTPTTFANLLVATTIIARQLDMGAVQGDATNGLTITASDGSVTRFPADGSPAQFAGTILAAAAIFSGNVSILGLTNVLQGLLRLGNGVVDPQTAPVVSTSWDSLPIPVDATFSPRGLVRDGSGHWRFALTVYGGGQIADITPSGSQNVGNNVPANFIPYGGVTQIGTSWYALGRDYTGTRNGDWWVYVFNSSFVKSGEWAAQTWMNSDSRMPAIGNDGTNVVIARVASNQHVFVESYTTAGSFITTPARVDCGVWDTDLVGVYVGAALFSTTRIVVASKAGPRVFNATSGARVNGDEWKTAGAGDMWGIFFDGSVWHHLSSKTIWHYTTEPNTSTQDFGYTWYDSNPAGAGTAESLPSPVRPFTVQRYSRTGISAPAPPNDGTVDGANAVRLYAGPHGGTLVWQATVGAAPWSTTAGPLASAGANPPTGTSGFAGRAASAPGEAASTTTDGSGVPVTRLRGDGYFRAEFKLQAGVDVAVPSGTGGATVAVPYLTPYPAGVVPAPVFSANDVNLSNPRVTAKSNTGFSVRWDRAATGTYSFNWQAIAP